MLPLPQGEKKEGKERIREIKREKYNYKYIKIERREKNNVKKIGHTVHLIDPVEFKQIHRRALPLPQGEKREGKARIREIRRKNN